MDVLPNCEKSEQRLAKRQKVVTGDEEDLTLGLRRAETEVEVIRQSRTHARPKRKTSRGWMVTVVSNTSVKKTVAPIVGGTVVDAADVTLPSSPVEDVRPEVEKKTSEEESKGVEVTFPDFLQDKLEETCGGLRISNENGQKMTVNLLARLEKSREAYDAAIKRSERLITTAKRREKMHVKDFAKVEARRAEEVRIAEELRGKIVESKTTEEELSSKLVKIASKCDKEFQRAEELSASLAEEVLKHEEVLTNWAKKLADCKSAQSSTVECRLKVESERQRLQEQIGKADM
ncbi:hypothetical protein AXG93_4698s1420 [Marchantia polymorpha subsp. ruderalis]|uniref:Uncharacterized protein n=1 Tax=Marchantia polymorpha subsp. ruderalis TaxID=1480154 RepID=A0A176VHY7_MARPO|nr:hypothetical protein AXG93_4698s1420 [Marchantia polymorpha subsp. ruderalis]